jgi:hypothetical protein
MFEVKQLVITISYISFYEKENKYFIFAHAIALRSIEPGAE